MNQVQRVDAVTCSSQVRHIVSKYSLFPDQ